MLVLWKKVCDAAVCCLAPIGRAHTPEVPSGRKEYQERCCQKVSLIMMRRPAQAEMVNATAAAVPATPLPPMAFDEGERVGRAANALQSARDSDGNYIDDEDGEAEPAVLPASEAALNLLPDQVVVGMRLCSF